MLIALAVALFIIEAHTGTMILVAGGIVALIIGLLFLINGSITNSDSGLAIVVILIVAFVAFATWRVVQIHRRRATTGREGLVGKIAVVRERLNPNGTVFLEGELWSAQSESGLVEVGQEVVVTWVDGLQLYVTKHSVETYTKVR